MLTQKISHIIQGNFVDLQWKKQFVKDAVTIANYNNKNALLY